MVTGTNKFEKFGVKKGIQVSLLEDFQNIQCATILCKYLRLSFSLPVPQSHLGSLKKILMPRSHSIPIKSESLQVQSKHRNFFKSFPGDSKCCQS